MSDSQAVKATFLAQTVWNGPRQIVVDCATVIRLDSGFATPTGLTERLAHFGSRDTSCPTSFAISACPIAWSPRSARFPGDVTVHPRCSSRVDNEARQERFPERYDSLATLLQRPKIYFRRALFQVHL